MLISVAALIVWLAGTPVWRAPERFPVFDLAVATIVFFSGAMFVAAGLLRRNPRRLDDLGLVYEVLCCLAISLAEQSLPYDAAHLVRGISWTALILTFFPLSVPATPGRTLLASLAGASMGPVGLLVAIAGGNPVPSAAVWAYLFVPTYTAAAIGWVASTTLHRLHRRAKEGRRLGAYQLEELLGRGGMGEVWRARHRFLARPAAIKLVRPEALTRIGHESGATTLRRFEREARATAMLRSPHTITLYDFGSGRDGSFYYVMELLDGLDLETLVRRHGPLPPPRVAHLLAQVCLSLAEAHAQGLIHRDIKPANIYLCRLGLTHDVAKVLDFGLVALASGQEGRRITTTGAISGTPAYMAPEMAGDNGQVDARADLYSLGCVAYWLLTGKLVFEDPTPVRVLIAHAQVQPQPPSQRTDQPIPHPLEELVLACLQKDPGKRPASALAVRHRLLEGAAGWSELDAQTWWAQHVPPTLTGPVQTETPATPRRA